MPDGIRCTLHGEQKETFVCSHLLNPTVVGLGFNCDEPSPEKPFPDAWCDDCEIIRAAHNGWTEESERLVKISLLCSGCYERARIRNTRTSITLDDLAGLRWKCGSCEEWHTGPCLDFGHDAPYHWPSNAGDSNRTANVPPESDTEQRKTFLSPDYCAIDDQDFFVRGVIQLPIIGTTESLCWGVWGSLSRQNFETLLTMDQNPDRADLPAMFSWLCTRLPDYPDTLSLKMYAQIQKPNMRPHFELELTDHLLSQEYHRGIAPERVKEIMLRHLLEVQ